MKVVDYLINKILEKGVTDVFGIPGTVVLPLLYGIENREGIEIHLNFHEQTAAYAATGYAQKSGRLGVAYATKGPGITNMITTVADAYCDSIPVLFITAHTAILNRMVRIEVEQEIDVISMVKGITKYSKRIDKLEGICEVIDYACEIAMSGRRGPVVLDIASQLFDKPIPLRKSINKIQKMQYKSSLFEIIGEKLDQSARPLVLLGDGIRYSNVSFEKVITQFPIVSSRFSQDLVGRMENYYGYVGSHGTRCANFLLSKADMIITIGNRMAFPIASESFKSAWEDTEIFRIDIDETELGRRIPNTTNVLADCNDIVRVLLTKEKEGYQRKEWLAICNEIREKLWKYETEYPVNKLVEFIELLPAETTIVCDIGNNELWMSQAYYHSRNKVGLMHSKAFKAVGSAIGKAIGTYYASKQATVCFCGDQGMQFNIQELQFISDNKLPIIIFVCNNFSSGMMKMSEKQKGYSNLLHVTYENGYSGPDFEKVAAAYAIRYFMVDESSNMEEVLPIIKCLQYGPIMIEFRIRPDAEVSQKLPKGNPCSKFIPELPNELYQYLDQL